MNRSAPGDRLAEDPDRLGRTGVDAAPCPCEDDRWGRPNAVRPPSLLPARLMGRPVKAHGRAEGWAEPIRRREMGRTR